MFSKHKILDPYLDFLKLVLPDVLLDHFDLDKSSTEHDFLHLYFSEKNVPPKEFRDVELVSKGFYDEITVQDFPLRGKSVFLHIKRRRWTEKKTKQVVKRNWELVGQGTRMTSEFADFLKEISQY